MSTGQARVTQLQEVCRIRCKYTTKTNSLTQDGYLLHQSKTAIGHKNAQIEQNQQTTGNLRCTCTRHAKAPFMHWLVLDTCVNFHRSGEMYLILHEQHLIHPQGGRSAMHFADDVFCDSWTRTAIACCHMLQAFDASYTWNKQKPFHWKCQSFHRVTWCVTYIAAMYVHVYVSVRKRMWQFNKNSRPDRCERATSQREEVETGRVRVRIIDFSVM